MLFRQQFVEKWFHARDELSFIEHCDRFGVPRPTAYEWLERYEARGIAGLEDRSSAPHSSPHATKPDIVEIILDARRAIRRARAKAESLARRVSALEA